MSGNEFLGSQNMPRGYHVEGGLWLIALGAAIADKDFRDDLLEEVGPLARNTEVRNMLIALGKGYIRGVHEGAQRIGFHVSGGDRCLPSLITSLKRRAVSKKCVQLANKLEYCARLTPENFLTMLKDAASEVEGAGKKAT